ncbi:MAG: heparan-alpha-glucosaminide N-acetyltransferase domain-containing protein [Lachnospiraceae bacterium]
MNSSNKKNNKNRNSFLDCFRGITLLNMILYHAIWDIVYIFGVTIAWYQGKLGFFYQQSICWSFILLSGYCFSYSKKPIKRGVMLTLFGLLLTLVTMIFMPANRVVFGILTFLGAAMLILSFTKKFFIKMNAKIGLFFALFLFFVFYGINNGGIGFLEYKFFTIPAILYNGYSSAFFGFPFYGFYSTDYFAVLPWFFLYLTGFYLNKVNYVGEMINKIPIRNNVLEWFGKHSLPIYILHQPIIYLLLFLYFR